LLLRIFYDPLLSALQNNEDERGYVMSVRWPTNVDNKDSWELFHVRIPAMAYMDDTIFIESSRERSQAIINLATKFYQMNDIFINGTKCELIIINPSVDDAQRSLTIGQDHTLIKSTTKEIRYLGVWIASKQQKRVWMNRLQNIVRSFVAIIQKKKIGIGHVTYLINKVLNPKLIYVAQLMPLTEKDWDILFTPILKMAKIYFPYRFHFQQQHCYMKALGVLITHGHSSAKNKSPTYVFTLMIKSWHIIPRLFDSDKHNLIN